MTGFPALENHPGRVFQPGRSVCVRASSVGDGDLGPHARVYPAIQEEAAGIVEGYRHFRPGGLQADIELPSVTVRIDVMAEHIGIEEGHGIAGLDGDFLRQESDAGLFDHQRRCRVEPPDGQPSGGCRESEEGDETPSPVARRTAPSCPVERYHDQRFMTGLAISITAAPAGEAILPTRVIMPLATGNV